MSNVAKRINIVSIKMVKESSFLYQTRTISSPNDAYEMIKYQLQDSDREQFIIACLNTKNEPINISVVSVGSLNKAIVHPREVFKTAILSNAASIVAYHNHSSNDTRPSQQDIQLTHRLVEAGELLGIKLLDHLIIGDGSPGSEQSEQSSAARVWVPCLAKQVSSTGRVWNIYIIKRKRLFIRS